MARLLLERKFGSLGASVLSRLTALPVERLDELILAIQDAPSLEALGLGQENIPS